jgi:hypothetical protein
MVTKGIAAAACLLLASLAMPAAAADIETRQYRQQMRIHQGIRSGELTHAEAGRLGMERARTERLEHRFRADGRFTPRERARIQHRLDRSSHHIYRARHNGWGRHNGWVRHNGCRTW